ncbi:MAG: YraN family protein [bacterium]|nr:YraN family protein [bacterium]
MSNIEIGKYGEKLACEFLIKKGYRIIETNYRYSKYGEIDIIAADKDVLCFIEVKTRTNNRFGTPMEAITKDKLLKIYTCIKNYRAKNGLKFKRARIDAVSIELNKDGAKITHIENLEI